MRIQRLMPFVVGLLVSCSASKQEAEFNILEGACTVDIKTDDKHSNIFVDGILIGHGKAQTKIPCGQKKIQIEAAGKKTIERYLPVQKRVPLELSFKLEEMKHIENWALSGDLLEQLEKGHGPYDVKNPKSKEIAAKAAKLRDKAGYYYTPEEMAAIAKKAAGSDDAAASDGAIQIDPNTNFDDPKTWL